MTVTLVITQVRSVISSKPVPSQEKKKCWKQCSFFFLYAPYVHLCCTFAHIQAQDAKENFASAELWAQKQLGHLFQWMT